MVLRLLRALLALGLLLVLASLGIIGTADTPHPRHPVPVATVTDATAPAVLLIGGGISCSATLASPTLALTAAHCLPTRAGRGQPAPGGTDTTAAEPGDIAAYVTARSYDDTNDTAEAAYECSVDHARVAAGWRPAADWAIVELTDCHDRDGRPADPIGEHAGYHPPRPWTQLAERDRATLTYLGYPTRGGRHGTLQTLAGPFSYRPLALRWFHPLAQQHFTCTYDAVVPAGGSGGGVIAPRDGGFNLVAVNNFVVADSHSCYRVVDEEVLEALEDAEGRW